MLTSGDRSKNPSGSGGVSGDKSGLFVQVPDFRVELVKGVAQRPGQLVVLRQEGVPLGAEDAQIQLAVKERDLEAVGGRGIAMRLRERWITPFRRRRRKSYVIWAEV